MRTHLPAHVTVTVLQLLPANSGCIASSMFTKQWLLTLRESAQSDCMVFINWAVGFAALTSQKRLHSRDCAPQTGLGHCERRRLPPPG